MWLNIHFHPEAKKYQPYLDGQKLMYCFAANEEECWADIHILGEDNYPYYVPFINDVATVRLYGYVKLKRVQN